MKNDRTINTLFLIQSVDCKISTDATYEMDADKDFASRIRTDKLTSKI